MRVVRASLLFLWFASAAVAAPPIDTKAIDAVMRDSVARWSIPGAAIAVVKDDKVIFLKAYGVRELGNPAAVTPDTLFQIASTSKAFTTTAMAMLADEQKLRWDDPVRKYLDYFRLDDPCADSLVTLRDIASHRTGLSRHDELWDYGAWSRAEILHRIGSVALTKPIRSTYQYQNIMFTAAGEVVASASGMPWEQFLATRIFQPLGMKETVIKEDDWQQAEHAGAYRWDEKTGKPVAQKTNSYESLGAAGTIKSSARDMAQWLRFQLGDGTIDGRRLISPDALNETKTPQTIIRNEGSTRDENPVTNIKTYGLGWNVQDYRGALLISHGGALNAFRTQVALLPDQHAGIVILANLGRGYGIIAARNAILDLFLGTRDRDWNAYFLALEEKSRIESEKRRTEKEAKRRRDTKPSHPLESYTGSFTNAAYGDATVSLVNGQLLIDWQRLHLPLTHDQYDTFSAADESEDVDEDVTFTTGRDGEIKSFDLFGETFERKQTASSPVARAGG